MFNKFVCVSSFTLVAGLAVAACGAAPGTEGVGETQSDLGVSHVSDAREATSVDLRLAPGEGAAAATEGASPVASHARAVPNAGVGCCKTCPPGGGKPTCGDE
jgi:hypothetical protein